MKRRLFVAGAMITAAGLGLTGCTGAAGTDTSAASGDGTTLSVSVWNYTGTPEFKALFDAFEEANPDITIEPVDILADDYAEKVTTMLAGGDTTDVLTMKNVTDYSRYANRGQLADITSLVEDELPADDLANLDAFDLDGKYFAAPYRSDFWVLFYNRALFDAKGLPYPDGIDWAGYADLATQLTGTADDGSAVYGAYQHTWRSTVQAVAAAQNDGDLISGDYGFMKQQYDTTVALQEAGSILDYATAKSQQTSYRTVFEGGQAAMMPMGSWYIAGILASKAAGTTSVDWGIAPLPQASVGDSTTFGSPTAFAVNKNAEHSEEAERFIAFASGEEGARAVASVGTVPALQSDAITEAYFGLEGMPSDDLSKKAFAPETVALEMPVSDISSDVDTILTEEHDLIMTGEKSVDDGIAEMESRVTSEVLD